MVNWPAAVDSDKNIHIESGLEVKGDVIIVTYFFPTTYCIYTRNWSQNILVLSFPSNSKTGYNYLLSNEPVFTFKRWALRDLDDFSYQTW